MSIPQEFNSVPVCYGLHPWDSEIEFIKLFDKVKSFKNLYAIGECGLDKNIPTPLEIQKNVFIHQIEISEKINKPLIIHAVGSINEIIDLKIKLKPSQPWIVHGFTGHPQLASQLIKENFIISFGESIFGLESKASRSLRILPHGSFFLETDESKRSIKDIYSQACFLRNESENFLINLLFNQFIDLFKLKDGVEQSNRIVT